MVSCKVVGLHGARRRLTNWQDTLFKVEFDQSMWEAKRLVLKIKSLKYEIIQDKRGNIMRAAFGIDVSKTSSEVTTLVNCEKIHDHTMLKDIIDLFRLFLKNMVTVMPD